MLPAADERGDGAEAFGLGKMFADPNLFGKLAANPRTAKHLADPTFVQHLQMIQTNPQLAEGALSDPRMIDVLGALMGIDMKGFAREEGSDELPPGYTKVEPEPEAQPASPPPQPAASSSSRSKPQEQPKPEDVEMAEPEDEDEAKARKEAEAEKKLGAEAYKAKKLDEAAAHFQKAWDLWPQDITFLTNLAGTSPALHADHSPLIRDV